MGYADKFNKVVARFDYELPKNAPYKKLAEIYKTDGDNNFTVRGLYINRKSKFGDSPVAIIDDVYINLPKHLIESVTEIISDSEAINSINNGTFGMNVYQYESNGNTYYSVNWIDV